MKRRRRRVRLSRTTRAQLGWWLGWLIACVGVLLGVGLAAAMVVAGLVLAGTFLLLYDVDEPDEEVRIR